VKRFVDEEDDSYESSSGSEDESDDTAGEGSDGEANPYADSPPPPAPPLFRCEFRGADFEGLQILEMM
jgi:hypothetical protein